MTKFTSLELGFFLNQISIGNRATKSITTPIFPASFPLGISSRLFNFLNKDSNTELSAIQMFLNLLKVNSTLSGSDLFFLLHHFSLNFGRNSLKTLSNNIAGKVKNL